MEARQDLGRKGWGAWHFFPLACGPDEKLVSGVMSERLSVAGCAATHVENILTLVRNGQIRTVAGMPGTTLADLVLVHASFHDAYTGIVRTLGN